MKKITLCLALLFTSTASLAQGDVWQTLFKEKLQEANQGSSNAQFDVGSMYQNGRGTASDRDRAIEWYQKAAAQNNTKASGRLKLMQANAERFKKESISASNGNKESQYKLGNMYTKGVGTNIDLAMAARSFEQSASQGYTKAEYKLGCMFYEGTGVKASSKTAYKWLSQAADKDYAPAQYYMGKMFAAGKGVKRDYAKALEWYSKALDGGFNQARSEMTAVTERMQAPARVVVAAPKVVEKKTVAKKAAPKKKVVAKKSKPAGKKVTTAKTSKVYGIEDLMVAAWSREGKPVAYLPSSINNCRTEKGKISCYSEDQTRAVAGGTVRFKTKSIMRSFSSDGSFQVSYRNLVIDSGDTKTETEADDAEIGSDHATADAYVVKTGWGKAHELECQMLEVSKVSCLKNKTHSFILVSPTTVAGK